MKRNKISRSEASLRIKAQMPLHEKRRKADYVIDNSGSIDSTKIQVEDLYKELRRISWWCGLYKWLFFLIIIFLFFKLIL